MNMNEDERGVPLGTSNIGIFAQATAAAEKCERLKQMSASHQKPANTSLTERCVAMQQVRDRRGWEERMD